MKQQKYKHLKLKKKQEEINMEHYAIKEEFLS